jgi:hypothetical protein
MKTQPQKANMVKYLDRLTANEKAVICFLGNNFPRLHYDLPKTEFHPGLLPFVDVKEVIHWLKKIHGYYLANWEDSKNPIPHLPPPAGPAGAEYNFYKYKRIAVQILAKLADACEDDKGVEIFRLYLDSRKVYRHFGSEPERGLPLNWLPKVRVTVGQRWSLPKKAFIPDKDVLVAPCVMLRYIKAYEHQAAPSGTLGIWEVNVSRQCRPAVENWLLETCLY